MKIPHGHIWTKRIVSNTIITQNGCWEWQGKPHHPSGYGRVAWRTNGAKGEVFAHRLSYRNFVGPFDESLFVLHKCDNRPCVNPDHLYAGTQAQNISDMVTRGRHKNQVKDHCIRGHSLSGTNVRLRRENGARQCIRCIKIRNNQRTHLHNA